VQDRAIANDCYKSIMVLNIGGAIKYVQGQMDHLNTTEKKLLQDIKQNKGKEAEQQEKDIEYQKTNIDVI
jgi:hypothetical protein